MEPTSPTSSGSSGRLIALQDRAVALTDQAVPIATERLGVFYSPTDGPPAQGDWPTVTWPLETPLAEIAEATSEAFPDVSCAILRGDDVRAVLAAVEGMPAGQSPLWHDRDRWYLLDLRPMLPDETGCLPLIA
jgi:hypothetical protein